MCLMCNIYRYVCVIYVHVYIIYKYILQLHLECDFSFFAYEYLFFFSVSIPHAGHVTLKYYVVVQHTSFYTVYSTSNTTDLLLHTSFQMCKCCGITKPNLALLLSRGSLCLHSNSAV